MDQNFHEVLFLKKQHQNDTVRLDKQLFEMENVFINEVRLALENPLYHLTSFSVNYKEDIESYNSFSEVLWTNIPVDTSRSYLTTFIICLSFIAFHYGMTIYIHRPNLNRNKCIVILYVQTIVTKYNCLPINISKTFTIQAQSKFVVLNTRIIFTPLIHMSLKSFETSSHR